VFHFEIDSVYGSDLAVVLAHVHQADV
jgi:hypothetical protein